MVKECPQCSELVHLRVEICPACSHKFEFKQKLSARAALVSPIASRNSKQWFEVSDVKYTKHEKYGAPPSLKVTYITPSGEPIREWVCIEHSGFAKKKAIKWMMSRRHWANTVDEAIVAKSCFLIPSKILVDLTGKYPVVEEAIFPREKKIAYN